MIPVYQTIFGTNEGRPGNCMQAVIASLLELPLNEVPHFLMYGEKWWDVMWTFLYSKGIELDYTLYNKNRLGMSGPCEFQNLKNIHGIKGYFYAVVYSPKHFDPSDFVNDKYPATHAVVIDNDFNIVHDPNPAYAGIKEYPLSRWLDYNGILSVNVLNDLYGMYL